MGAATCVPIQVLIGGKRFSAVPYERRRMTVFEGPQGRCPCCNVKPGGYHHVGCTVERCPCCGDIWVFCRCTGWKVPAGEPRKTECRVIPFPGCRP